MKKVERSELMDLGDYDEVRERFRQRIIEMKKVRRLGVGDHMTFIFENHDTVLFQIQEMLRTERITQEKAIEHELETYNQLVPGEGELFATLMIEYSDKAVRQEMLRNLAGLHDHVVLRLGERGVPAQFEKLPGEEEDRLPAVNYVRFRVGKDAAAILRDSSRTVRMDVTHPSYEHSAEMPGPMRKQLADELEEE